eukprot:scaffold47189_cov73-Phaeocystis_antarctica.AAC.5
MTLSRCSTSLLCAGSHDAKSAKSFFRRAHNRRSSGIEAGRPGRVSDETRPMCASSTSSTSRTSVTPCVAQQRACIVLSPVAANHREEHDGNLIQCRLPHLQQAPGSRQDALRGDDDEDVRLVNAYHTGEKKNVAFYACVLRVLQERAYEGSVSVPSLNSVRRSTRSFESR